MEKNNRKAISSMASDTDHRTAYDSHLHSDVVFLSVSLQLPEWRIWEIT